MNYIFTPSNQKQITMLRPELYERTVNILVQAYFKGTLEYTECEKCAVGNIVAGNMGVRPAYLITDRWADAILFGEGQVLSSPSEESLRQISITGYSPQEIAYIEQAFYFGVSKFEAKKDQENFNGLMSVVECLDKIHENDDTQVTTNSKNKFNKQLQTV